MIIIHNHFIGAWTTGDFNERHPFALVVNCEQDDECGFSQKLFFLLSNHSNESLIMTPDSVLTSIIISMRDNLLL